MQRQSLIVLALACAAGACSPKKDTANPDGDAACTEEAKECPDGTSVSRTGPNCEFPACPGEDAADPASDEPADADPASDEPKSDEEKTDGETPAAEPPA